MLKDLNSKKISFKEDGAVKEFLHKVKEVFIDIGLEEVENTQDFATAFMMLPVLGPAPTPARSGPDTDVYSWLIEGHEKRGLPPPKYEDLVDGKKQVASILRMCKEWVFADEKTFWRT